MPLVWALRELLGLTGTKFGCGAGQCGACTVHIAGRAVRSCTVRVADVNGPVVTIEGVRGATAERVLHAWDEHQVAQCGYCQPGQVMSAVALLIDKPRPDDADIDAAMAGNICRCATYLRIRRAIHAAAVNG
jgi:isoquinoline 1-oxidoreductase alpha subunit